MQAIVTIQLPILEEGYGRILAASGNPSVVKTVCTAILREQQREVDDIDDPFERELALLQLEQLKARLSFAVRGNDG